MPDADSEKSLGGRVVEYNRIRLSLCRPQRHNKENEGLCF